MPEPIDLWPNADADADHGQRPTLVPYLLDGDAPRPMMIVLPGGGYGRQADHEAGPIAELFNVHGFHAAVLYYRVSPNRHPKEIHDAQRAVRMVRERASVWHVNPDAVGILGFSAGGHLASTLTVHGDRFENADDDLRHHSARVNAAVLCYPVIDMTGGLTHKGSRMGLLGREPDVEQMALMTTFDHVDANTPPTFLWHTYEDGAVDMRNSLRFAEACKEHSVPVELHVYERGHHGLGLAADHPDVATWADHCIAFCKRHLGASEEA